MPKRLGKGKLKIARASNRHPNRPCAHESRKRRLLGRDPQGSECGESAVSAALNPRFKFQVQSSKFRTHRGMSKDIPLFGPEGRGTWSCGKEGLRCRAGVPASIHEKGPCGEAWPFWGSGKRTWKFVLRRGSDGAEDGVAGAEEVVAGFLHAVAEALLALLQIGTRIVGFFVADLAVDLEDAVVVFHHVGHDGTGEGVLGIGVDVHLDDAVAEGLADFFERGAGAAVEDEVHLSRSTVFGGDGSLAILEDGGLEFDGAGLVGAVDVAKGGGEHEAADAVEGFIDGDHVFRGGVELVIGDAGGVVTVFFTADDASLDFENDVERGALFKEFLGDFDVLFEAEFGAVEHVGVEEIAFAGLTTCLGGGEEGLQKLLDVLRMAVIRVEGDEDVVTLSEDVNGLSEDDGSEGHVFDGGAGGELTTAGGDLNDAVGLALSEGLQGSIDGGQRGDVDGGIGITTLLGGIKHGTVLSGSGDGHL